MEKAKCFLLTSAGVAGLPGLTIAQNQNPTIEDFFFQLKLDSWNLLLILLIFLGTWGITRLLKLTAQWLAEGRYHSYSQWIWSWYPRINILIWGIVLFGITKMIFPDDRGAVLAFLASSTIVIGVAAQDAIKNLLGGLLIFAEHPFQLKDRIHYGGYYGTVENISLRSTQLRTLDDSIVTVPNSKVFSESLSNANSSKPYCMVVIDLWLSHDVDINQAKQLAMEAAITSRYLNFDKEVQLLFTDYYDQHPSTRLSIKAYVFNKEFEKTFATEITETAKKAFLKAGLYHSPARK